MKAKNSRWAVAVVFLSLLGAIAIGCFESTPTAPVEPSLSPRWQQRVRDAAGTPAPTVTPMATPEPTPSPTPEPTPGPSPSPDPSPTPVPTATPLPLQTNLIAKKNRRGTAAGHLPMTPAGMRALPIYGPEWTLEEYLDLLEREGMGVVLQGEMVYFTRVADGGTYGYANADGDWHIEIREPSNLKRGQTIRENIVTEITPHFLAGHPEWTDARLSDLSRFRDDLQINPKGALVRVYGWLMYDIDHESDVGVYRSTPWEVHPITYIEYFDEATSSWVALK